MLSGVVLTHASDELGLRLTFSIDGANLHEDVSRETGPRTFAMVQPMLPGSVSTMADALATHAGSVSPDVLRGVQGAADDFSEHPEAATDEWQQGRATDLRRALSQRGVPLWSGELPPDL